MCSQRPFTEILHCYQTLIKPSLYSCQHAQVMGYNLPLFWCVPACTVRPPLVLNCLPQTLHKKPDKEERTFILTPSFITTVLFCHQIWVSHTISWWSCYSSHLTNSNILIKTLIGLLFCYSKQDCGLYKIIWSNSYVVNSRISEMEFYFHLIIVIT